MFGSTNKRITKLTDKAKAALEDSNKKHRDTEPLLSEEDVPTKPTQSHKSVVQTEEEEAAMYEDAIEISDADNKNEDGPSNTDKEESPKDDLSALNQFVNDFGVNYIREDNERLDLTGLCFFQSDTAYCHD
ncbi:hypothetical protein BDR03DRAFT_983973 [Suillus americanus]|nr:hypothetical protein BDR03DRAFT_983973 [Suillus americanus]